MGTKCSLAAPNVYAKHLYHSVASLYFPNESTVDIATVRGGPAYSHAMHLAGSGEPPSITGFDYSAKNPAQAIFNGVSLRDHLPSWLGGHHDSSSTPFTAMLNSLKTATESYLGHPIATVEIAVPFPISMAWRDLLHQASAALSLNVPTTLSSPAGIYAALAQGTGGSCYRSTTDGEADDPEQLILTVAYTDAALTALLVDEECGVFEWRRVLHDTTLGRAAIKRQCETASAADCILPLTQALSDLIRLPLEDGNGADLTHISELVLHGEAANDPQLHFVLGKVLYEHHSPIWRSTITPDLPRLFKAARGLAWQSWYRADSASHPGDPCY